MFNLEIIFLVQSTYICIYDLIIIFIISVKGNAKSYLILQNANTLLKFILYS